MNVKMSEASKGIESHLFVIDVYNPLLPSIYSIIITCETLSRLSIERFEIN